MSEKEDRLLKTDEVARRIGISVRGVWRLVASGGLKQPVKVMGVTRWFESDILAYFCKLKERRDNN